MSLQTPADLHKKYLRSYDMKNYKPYFYIISQIPYQLLSPEMVLTTGTNLGCYPPCELAKNHVDQVPNPLGVSQPFPEIPNHVLKPKLEPMLKQTKNLLK